MSDIYPDGLRVVDVNGKTGRIDQRVTLGRFGTVPDYSHAYDVTYDDGTQSRRMHYHLAPEEN